MSYSIVEAFSTIQGEGKWAGRAAVFLRFTGCNMWNGRPEDRSKGKGACAMWCDTNFAKGTIMSLAEVVTRLEALWKQHDETGLNRMVVMTGGEPTLQVDDDLVKALAGEGWFTAIETNGSVENPTLEIIDHVCVSPKQGRPLKVWGAHELKVVYPGGVPGAPDEMQWSEDQLKVIARDGDWGALYLQPQDVTDVTTVEVTALTHRRNAPPDGRAELARIESETLYRRNVERCVDFILRNPGWRLSLQTHKYIGVR